jgi:hypothetical protein
MPDRILLFREVINSSVGSGHRKIHPDLNGHVQPDHTAGGSIASAKPIVRKTLCMVSKITSDFFGRYRLSASIHLAKTVLYFKQALDGTFDFHGYQGRLVPNF